jgi:hypothetical protein
MFDLTHTLDQGILLHLVANILFAIAVYDMDGDSSDNFDHLWQRMSEIYKELGLEHVLTKLVFSQVCDPKAKYAAFPCLSKVEATEARHLLKVAAVLAEEKQGPSDLHKHRTACAKALVNFYDMLESSGQTIEEFVQLKRFAQQFQLRYQFLSKEAMKGSQLLWSVVNKFHFFEHLVDQAEFENPILYWAYSGEDRVGRVARIAHLCLPGKPTHAITQVLFDRHSIGLHLRLARME